MPTHILQTKFYNPAPTGVTVSRPRLLDRLDAGIQRGYRLILVSAPAGFGKTTLVADWLHRESLPDRSRILDRSVGSPSTGVTTTRLDSSLTSSQL